MAKQQIEPRSVPTPETVEEENEDEDFYGPIGADLEEPEVTRRSSREVQKPERYAAAQVNKDRRVSFQDQESHDMEQVHNLVSESKTKENTKEYDTNEAIVMARMLTEMNFRVSTEGATFAQQYSLKTGLKNFGLRGEEAASKELDQLHQRNCFNPIDVALLTPSEKKKAQMALMFLTEKRDGSVKGRMVYNGKPTREWLSKDDAASPTASLEAIMLTAVIDAKEGRDVMTADIPNAFIQTKLPDIKDGEDRVVLKITGVLVDLLVQMAPEVYGPYVVLENGKRVLYLVVLRGLYGMLIAALLWYRLFSSDLMSVGFEINPYDPCVLNRIREGIQHTVLFHVDDLMSSVARACVNTAFLKWLNKKYGKHGEVKATRGKRHDYLGMTIDFSTKGKVVIDMCDYIKNMLADSSVILKPDEVAPTPATDNLFTVNEESPLLPKKQAEEYHTMVAKGLFVCRRARPDIHTTIAALCTRVRAPTQDDWCKLVRLLKYLNGTKADKLTLSADDLHVVKWYVDASFAVHPDFKSHTGGMMTFGSGAVQSISRKQKLNTRSSTESELVAADDAATLIMWTQLFLEAQGYGINRNVLYQDNKSTILLENNGKRSSSKRTRAINIRYFFLTDQIEKGRLQVVYCPTEDMTADFFSKPLQGTLFQKFKREIMGV